MLRYEGGGSGGAGVAQAEQLLLPCSIAKSPTAIGCGHLGRVLRQPRVQWTQRRVVQNRARGMMS